jgi:hypothetical protein
MRENGLSSRRRILTTEFSRAPHSFRPGVSPDAVENLNSNAMTIIINQYSVS